MSERWEFRPSQSSDWIEVSGEPEFDVRRDPQRGFSARDFKRQVEVYFASLDEAKAWCEQQLAAHDPERDQ